MTQKIAVFGFGALLSVLCVSAALAQDVAGREESDGGESSIWDDDSSGDSRYFTRKKGRTAADIKREEAKFAPKKKTATKFVYTGPTKEDIAKQAPVTAQQNFRKLLSPEYDYKFGKVEYNVDTDSFKVTDLTALPKSEAQRKKGVYAIKVGSVELYKFNIGERGGTKQNPSGQAILSEIDIPVFNANAVKTGQVKIDGLKADGRFTYLMEKGSGVLDKVAVSGLRSEKIINETILNNIVRAKVFSANSAEFENLNVPAGFMSLLKNQSFKGFNFSSAVVNGKRIPTPAGAEAAMISYSSRFLDADLVMGARMEKAKKNPIANMDAVKRNVTAHKQSVAEFEKEFSDGGKAEKVPARSAAR